MLPPELRALRLLETCYDGAVPPDEERHARAADYTAYTRLVAQAAAQRFQRRVQAHIQMLQGWRLQPHAYRWHQLRTASLAVQTCRLRAREAFDLCA